MILNKHQLLASLTLYKTQAQVNTLKKLQGAVQR